MPRSIIYGATNERLVSFVQAIEASAFEQRQKILLEITSLREREDKLTKMKEALVMCPYLIHYQNMSILVNVYVTYSLSIKQERREEKLDERELSLRAQEEEVVHVRKTLYAQADDIVASFVPSLSLTSLFLCESPHNNLFLEPF